MRYAIRWFKCKLKPPKNRGCKPTPPKKENVVKRKRGQPKNCVITDNINNDDDDDVFCEPHQPKRIVYKRESKSKGRVFIKVVTGKNKNGKKGKKRDLETAFNDIDILLENMGTAERSIVGDSNVEERNLQVASTHQIEEGNEKELCQRNLGQIKEESTHDDGTEVTDEIVTDGIVTYGIGTEYDSDKKITDGIVTVEIGSKEDGELQNLQRQMLRKKLEKIQIAVIQNPLQKKMMIEIVQIAQITQKEQ